MALINCPECGKEISDKVKACPHCGYPLVEENIEANPPQPQQVEITSVNLKKKVNWKPIVIGAILVVIGVVAYAVIQKMNEKKAQETYQKTFNSYVDDLFLLQIATISAGSEAEDLTNLTAKVWANSIYEEKDVETDKYTRTNGGKGSFYDDFNTALGELFSDSTILSKIKGIKDTQDTAQEIASRLQNPPAGLENCYDTATELYTAFKAYTDFAISPTGSLQTFNEQRRSKSDALLNAYNKLETQIPEKYPIAEDEPNN